MSTPTDDFEEIPDGELLAPPSGSIPPGWLREFGREAALVHQQDTDELALELSGNRASAGGAPNELRYDATGSARGNGAP